MKVGFRTSPQDVTWSQLEEAWAEAGRHDDFDSGWMNDHLGLPGRDRGGSSFEPLTALAALAHHVPGKTIGQTVLSATFRHPAILAREALTLDRRRPWALGQNQDQSISPASERSVARSWSMSSSVER